MTARELRDQFLSKVEDGTLTERLFSEIPDVVFCLKNLERVYVSANDAFAERVGLGSRWEVVGKTAEDLFPKVLADHYQEQDNEVIESQEGFRERLELVPLRDGSLGWFLASKVPIYGEGHHVIGLASISRDLKIPSGKEQGFAQLVGVVREIENHFRDDLCRRHLATQADMSEAQLERRMKRVFGMSLSGLIRKTRVEHGSRLLIETKKSLSDIAQDCGYSEQSAFTRQFKSTVGIPPGKYRGEFGGWW